MKTVLLRVAAVSARWALRAPLPSHLKRFIWDRFLRPYVLWRHLEVIAKGAFGARFKLDLSDGIQQYIYFFGIWEPTICAHIRSVLRPGDIVIDVGANIGHHTMLASTLVGSSGHIYAIEASPLIFEKLKETLQLNGSTNVTPINVAVTDRRCQVQVYLHDRGNRGSTTIVESVSQTRHTTKEALVPGLPLADIICPDAIRRTKLVKIDVEGAEWLVLVGMKSILAQFPDDCEFLVEISTAALGNFGKTPTDIYDIFASAGFSPLMIRNDYSYRAYLGPAHAALVPIPPSFDQIDVVFRKQRI